MKKCIKCGEVSNNFSPEKKVLDGLQAQCRVCFNKRNTEYIRTKSGLISKIYKSQKRSSRKRNHELPTYSLADLRKWCLSQDLFHVLYEKWKKSGYDTKLIPSCDRTDNTKGYALERLQLVTWKENKINAEKDMREGRLVSGREHIPVEQWTLSGKFVKTYISLSEAMRETQVNCGGIRLACMNKKNQAGGYKWKFVQKET